MQEPAGEGGGGEDILPEAAAAAAAEEDDDDGVKKTMGGSGEGGGGGGGGGGGDGKDPASAAAAAPVLPPAAAAAALWSNCRLVSSDCTLATARTCCIQVLQNNSFLTKRARQLLRHQALPNIMPIISKTLISAAGMICRSRHCRCRW